VRVRVRVWFGFRKRGRGVLERKQGPKSKGPKRTVSIYMFSTFRVRDSRFFPRNKVQKPHPTINQIFLLGDGIDQMGGDSFREDKNHILFPQDQLVCVCRGGGGLGVCRTDLWVYDVEKRAR
jgi:hypothetical protein